MTEPDSKLMLELVRLYRLSSSPSEFLLKVEAITDDPELVTWATNMLFGETDNDTGDTHG